MSHFRVTPGGVLVPFSPHIIKRNYVEAECGQRMGLEGLYRLQVRRADGSLKRDTGWFKNLILDSGLNRLGAGGAGTHCAIGTGTATPATTQTGLQALAASTNNINAYQFTNLGAPDYIFAWTRTYRFALGALNGNYSEVGVGWADISLFSRALILDGGGAPTTITVLPDEQLDVIYQLRQHIPMTDWGGTYTIGGSSYDVIGRRVYAGTTWSNFSGPLSGRVTPLGMSGETHVGLSGDIGPATGYPAGSSDNQSSDVTHPAYSAGTFQQASQIVVQLNRWNFAGGLRSIALNSGTPAAMQTQYQFDPKLPKDSTKTLTLVFNLAWARRP